MAAALLATASCGGGERGRDALVTYFNGDHAVSLRYPPSWRGDQAEQDGVWYRYFLAPPEPGQARAPVSVTLMAGPMAVTVEEYAKTYLAGHAVTATRPEERQGIAGQSWAFSSADGRSRHRLLLLDLGGRVLGLYAQGETPAVEKQARVLDEMWSSLTVERPERYPVVSWKEQEASLGLPHSWRETRRFSGGGTMLTQFVSPPLAVDKGRETVHASLTATFEAVPEGGSLAEYYEASRQRLGENFQVTNHSSFRDGYVDVMRTETPVAIAYVKRFYFARGGRGCSLVFEAREDIFPRASRWADYIASTLVFGDGDGKAGK